MASRRSAYARLAFFLFPVIAATLAPGVAEAAVTSVSVLSSTSTRMGGKRYVEVTALMKGVAPGGAYSVPITLLYPENPRQCNGTGIVDLINNSATYAGYVDFCQIAPALGQGALCPFVGIVPPFAVGHALLGEEFLGDKGYVYFSLQMEKAVIDIVNDPSSPPQSNLFTVPGLSPIPPGSFIAEQGDGYQIVDDSEYLIKHLWRYRALPSTPCSVDRSIAFGYSRSACTLRTMFADRRDPGFDGYLVGAGGGTCHDIEGNPLLPPTTPLPAPFDQFGQPSPAPAEGPPSLQDSCGSFRPVSGKAIAVGTETEDQLMSGPEARGETASYRIYEIAGTSHVSKDVVDTGPVYGSTRQNPIPTGPVFRAMVENLRAWITCGTQPPPSVTLSAPLGSDPFPAFFSKALVGFYYSGFAETVVRFARDADGNALGGVRLPHVATRVRNRTVGAPLGTYTGAELNVSVPPFNGVFPNSATAGITLSGTFDPFTPARIATAYPTHAGYVLDVARAAQYAFEQRWILAEDRDAYIERATQCQVGRVAVLTQEQLDFCAGL